MGRLIPMAPKPVPPTLPAATGAFLDQRDHAPSTRRVYTASLAALVDGFGAATEVDELDPAGTAAWFRLRYTAAAPATWNREIATLRSAVTWWRAQGWLERLVATAREQAAQQLHAELAALPDEQQRGQLAGLLTVDEVTRTSRLERLRRGPTSVTAAASCSAPRPTAALSPSSPPTSSSRHRREAGFVGAAVVLVLLAWLCLRALRISGAALDGYGALLAGGIAVWLDVQAFINVAMTLGTLPVTGIPLPFISLAGQTNRSAGVSAGQCR